MLSSRRSMILSDIVPLMCKQEDSAAEGFVTQLTLRYLTFDTALQFLAAVGLARTPYLMHAPGCKLPTMPATLLAHFGDLPAYQPLTLSSIVKVFRGIALLKHAMEGSSVLELLLDAHYAQG